MALFRYDPKKEGPGVEKDEAPSPGYIRYWKLFFRNFNKMLGYSTIYFVLMLPLICFAVYFVTVRINPALVENYLETYKEIAEGVVVEEGQSVMFNSWFVFIFAIVFAVPRWLSVALVIICAVVIGPINCGIVYCMRNHAREEHVWFSDMFVRAWRNRRQGLFFGILDSLITISALVYIFAGDTLGLPGWLFTYMRWIAIGIFVIYQVMRWYIYQMIVTFNLRIRGMLKNAWMFVILGWKRNLVAFIFSVLFIGLTVFFPLFYPSAMPFALLIMMMLFWGLIMFLAVFTTYPVKHKYLVAPALAEQRKKERARKKAEAESRGEVYIDEDDEESDETEAEPEEEDEAGSETDSDEQ